MLFDCIECVGSTYPPLCTLSGLTDRSTKFVAGEFMYSTMEAHDAYGNRVERGGDQIVVHIRPPSVEVWSLGSLSFVPYNTWLAYGIDLYCF